MQEQERQELFASANTNREYVSDVDYESTRRSGVEAVLVGRQVVGQAQAQGEQLLRANQHADATQADLYQANRLLRGMSSWSGWVANIVTKSSNDSQHASATTKVPIQQPGSYDNLPANNDTCRAIAQAIQNYRINVSVLEECETEEQKETCRIICDNMYNAAQTLLDEMTVTMEVDPKQKQSLEAYQIQFTSDLGYWRKMQVQSQSQIRGLSMDAASSPVQHSSPSVSVAKAQSSSNNTNTKNSTSATATSLSNDNGSLVQVQLQKQDEHLSFLGQTLGELSYLAHSISDATSQQNKLIEELDNKATDITESSQMVTRRTDRLIQNKSWTPVKPVFDRNVAIRHVDSGKYLGVVKGDLYLMPRLNERTCVFALYKRQGQIFGLQNKQTKQWMGQSLLGNLTCSARSFGRREEWEATDESNGDGTVVSRLLCASAGWGAGGYLEVRKSDFAVSIGGCSPEERKNADIWALIDQV